jgi:hypothetical protein
MIDNNVFQRISTSSIFKENYPEYSQYPHDFFNSNSYLTQANRGKRSNLSILLNCIEMNKKNAIKEKECLLCLQSMTKGKKFGLLSNFLCNIKCS